MNEPPQTASGHGTVLALIPARGGSKGIPGKNIAPVAGRPLIAWTIAAARAATGIDRVVVSTDAPEIAEVAKAWGAEVPFLRPPDLARDDTPGIAPPLHALRWLNEHEGYRPDGLMLLQPTSPLRIPADIDGAIALWREKAADSVVSVTAVEKHPYLMKRLEADGRMSPFLTPDKAIDRRQDLPQLYSLNGALWLIRSDVLLAKEDWYTDQTFAFVMPASRSLDVDTRFDLQVVDLLLGAKSA